MVEGKREKRVNRGERRVGRGIWERGGDMAGKR